nr:actin cytoskeleton-regulatory complex protein PAN1-like [Aegilops tauschii subsp. strangulata]
MSALLRTVQRRHVAAAAALRLRPVGPGSGPRAGPSRRRRPEALASPRARSSLCRSPPPAPPPGDLRPPAAPRLRRAAPRRRRSPPPPLPRASGLLPRPPPAPPLRPDAVEVPAAPPDLPAAGALLFFELEVQPRRIPIGVTFCS